MQTEKYKKDDGYEGPDGCFYDNAEDLIAIGFLKFCGCGIQEGAMEYTMRGMEFVAEERPNGIEDRAGWDAWYKDWRARIDAHFKSEGAEYFFWYWLAEMEFTEHGSSVPGWLSDSGKEVLTMLREWHSAQSRSGES